MNPLKISSSIKSRWYHRLYQVISVPLIIVGIWLFAEAGRNLYSTRLVNSKIKAEEFLDSKKEYTTLELDAYQRAFERAAWDQQQMFIAFLPWVFVAALYRTILYVCVGGRAFQNDFKNAGLKG